MSKIFINYRRKDSVPYAGRLYDRLAGHFGPDHVFMDIGQIEPGDVFDQVILEKLKAVQAAVVLIGPHWLDIAEANGQRRLDDPDDWVRREIAALLKRDIRVIPVLVGGAEMPKLTQLPECLASLTERHAIEITDRRFHADTDELIKALERSVSVQMPQFEVSEIPKKQKKSSFPRFAAIAGVTSLFFAVGAYFGLIPPKSTPIQPKSETELQSTVTVIEPEMVHVPSGEFMMGSLTTESGQNSNESSQHKVIITYAFEISKFEVTFDEYDAFAKATGNELPDDSGWGRGKRPVINVSFNDAQAYVKWLSDKTGKKYRLPSEAEWEYVARAGTQTYYWWGDEIGHNNANCDGCGSYWDDKQTAPVGSFKANTFGLYDTAGNVEEWVEDCWHHNYRNAPTNGSAWRKGDGGDCDQRVVRGGAWNKMPQDLRSTHRDSYYTEYMGGGTDVQPATYPIYIVKDYLGFRIVRVL